MMQMLKDGPLRLGTYLGPSPASNGQLVNRAHVLMENGDTAFPVILDSQMAESLACGDSILLDAQARAVIVRGSGQLSHRRSRRVEAADRRRSRPGRAERSQFRSVSHFGHAQGTTRLRRGSTWCGSVGLHAAADGL